MTETATKTKPALCYRARLLMEHAKQGSRPAGGSEKIGRFVYDGVLRYFRGEPPKSLLDRDDVEIMDMHSRPWPGSVRDRLMMAPHPDVAARLHEEGKPAAGPGFHLRMREAGLWPDAEEVRLQKFRLAALNKPEELAGRVVAETEHLKPGTPEYDKAVRRVMKGWEPAPSGSQLPDVDVDDLLK